MALGKLAKGSVCSSRSKGHKVKGYKRCPPNSGQCSASDQISVKGYTARKCSKFSRKGRVHAYSIPKHISKRS